MKPVAVAAVCLASQIPLSLVGCGGGGGGTTTTTTTPALPTASVVWRSGNDCFIGGTVLDSQNLTDGDCFDLSPCNGGFPKSVRFTTNSSWKLLIFNMSGCDEAGLVGTDLTLDGSRHCLGEYGSSCHLESQVNMPCPPLAQTQILDGRSGTLLA